MGEESDQKPHLHRGLPNVDRDGKPVYNVALNEEEMTAIIMYFRDEEVDEEMCQRIERKMINKRRALRQKVHSGNFRPNSSRFNDDEKKSDSPQRQHSGPKPRRAFGAD